MRDIIIMLHEVVIFTQEAMKVKLIITNYQPNFLISWHVFFLYSNLMPLTYFWACNWLISWWWLPYTSDCNNIIVSHIARSS